MLDRVRAALIHMVGRFANYGSFESGPRVTIPRLHAGDVKVALSVLYSFWDELDWPPPKGANSPPDDRYFSRLVRQLEEVEAELDENHSHEATIARTPAELEAALAGEKTVLVHCLEGAYHLGRTPERIAANVAELADRGVAYVTIGHLFNRGVAEVANAIPFIPDWTWRLLFAQPQQPLHEPARDAIQACVEQRVLIDLCHMTEHAIDATLSLLDRLDPQREVPVIATHAGYRFGRQEYMPCERHVRAIADRGGVIGLIFAEHQLSDGLGGHSHSRRESIGRIVSHVDRIREITGSGDHVGIGTDFDGFIKPTLSGFDDASSLAGLEAALGNRYGAEDAEKICSGNALRLLRTYWRS
jgi:microsomal dipeptidase-like Zn-dependent dipeptidase